MAASALLTRLSIFAACLFGIYGALAQSLAPQLPRDRPEMTESCPGLVASDRPRVLPAALRPGSLAPNEARITYVGHSTFMIESPKLVRIATDFNDYLR